MNLYLFHEIISTDEEYIKLFGQVNRHNCLYWCTGNPYITMESQLNQPDVSVSGGMVTGE